MQSNTAKIFFVVCVLLQGTNSIKADQLRQGELIAVSNAIFKREKKESHSSQSRSKWLVATTSRGKILQKPPRISSESEFIPTNKYISTNDLSHLDAPPNLLLPSKNNDFNNRSLYPIKIHDLKDIIENNSPKLEIARKKITQQQYKLEKAIGSWYPTIDLGATPKYLSGENFPEDGSDTTSKELKTTLSVDINWKLLDPTRSPRIAAAKDTFEKSKISYLIQLKDLYLEALNAYFLLQSSDEGVRIGKESLNASQISLKDAKSRFKAGLGTRLEVLEAETQLARDKRLLSKKISTQNINRSSLANILNLPPQFIPIAASPSEIIGTWTATLEESIISAYTLREELENIRLDISIQNSNANAALAFAQPNLSIFNNFSKSYTNGKLSSVETDGSIYSNTVGMKATWKIFDGGIAKADYKLNKQVSRINESEFAVKRNEIRQEIEKNFFQLQNATQDIASSTREVMAAKESLRLARLRFKAGLTTQREVVNNQRDLTQAEVGYTEAITAYNKSISTLQRITGINHVEACDYPKLIPTKNHENNPDTPLIETLPATKPCPKSSTKNQR